MNRKKLKLYFVAIVPEEPVYSEVLAFKTEFHDRFNSSAALRSPPHITLHMPFQWPEEKEDRLSASLDIIARQNKQFKLTLADFDAFPPRVVYIGVEEKESLNIAQKAISRNARENWHIYPKPNSRAFTPHITIAFRDLKKPIFFEAWQEFKQRTYSAEFKVAEFCLLKHNGKLWEIHHRASLSVQ